MKTFFHKHLALVISCLLMIAIIGVIIFGLSIQKASAAWYTTGGTWLYRKSIIINHTKVGTVNNTDQTDFPVLISVTDPDLASNALSNGNDIIFTAADGSTLLNYEIESYNSSTGVLVAWVKVPTLSHTVDTTIYEYYGNASASAETSGNKTGTWDTNYLGVWHVATVAGSPSGKDSTSNNLTPTFQNSPTAQTGQMDGAIGVSSSGNTYFTFPEQDVITSTISFWTTGGTVGTPLGGGADGSYPWFISGSNLYYHTHGGSFGIFTAPTWSGPTLYKVDIVRNGTTVNMYINGVAVGGSPQTLGDNTYVGVGSIGGGNGYEGTVDELRVSNTAESVDWLTTEYNNQSSPGTFYTYEGSAETQSSPVQTNVIVRGGGGGGGLVKVRGGVVGGGSVKFR